MSRLCTWCAGAAFVGGILMPGTAASAAAAEGKYQYVGSKACKKCHFKQHKSWAKTKMALAFNVLKPISELKPSKRTGLTKKFIDEIKAAKEKAKIDPNEDFTKDPKCLKCHTTGYGKPGGYAIPDPSDRRAKRKAQALEGIGCESGHGPGSEYTKIQKEIQDKQRQYTPEEFYAAGMHKISAESCTGCHTKEGNPTAGDDYKFEYEKKKDEGTHEHLELKLRKK